MFRNVRFYGERLLALRPTPTLDYQPLVGCSLLLIPYIFAASLHIWRHFFNCNQRTRLAIVTGPTYDGYVVCLQAIFDVSNVRVFDINEKESESDRDE
jgi:hypothetical protein